MSLDLDTRQPAMLQQMGVRVWWPQYTPSVVAVDAIKNVAAYASYTGHAATNHLIIEDFEAVP